MIILPLGTKRIHELRICVCFKLFAMSFGGHVQDMVNRVKQNAALKNARRKKFKGGNDYSKTEYKKTSYDFPEMTPEEFKKFKNTLKVAAKQEQKNRTLFILFAIVLPIIIGFIIFVLF